MLQLNTPLLLPEIMTCSLNPDVYKLSHHHRPTTNARLKMAVPFPFEIPWGYNWQINLQVFDHEGTKWSTMKDLSGQTD